MAQHIFVVLLHARTHKLPNLTRVCAYALSYDAAKWPAKGKHHDQLATPQKCFLTIDWFLSKCLGQTRSARIPFGCRTCSRISCSFMGASRQYLYKYGIYLLRPLCLCLCCHTFYMLLYALRASQPNKDKRRTAPSLLRRLSLAVCCCLYRRHATDCASEMCRGEQ